LFTDSTATHFGVTVAGACNISSSTNPTVLNSQSDVMLDYSNNLYTGDNSFRLFIFELNNFTGRALRSFPNWPAFLFYDNRTSYIYITVLLANLAYIWPTNQTIPASGIINLYCSMNSLYYPSGIVVDSVGNAYISSFFCNWIMKWAPNATNATLIAGSASGTAGSDSLTLYTPYNLALDEVNSFIYVADRYNHRVQRFPLDGSGIGVTVAGGNGQGSAANQLDRPPDIFVSKIDGSIYVADCYNNRIQKWLVNATSGITVAGSSLGAAGSTPYLMNQTYGLAVDAAEKYLYVSDSKNNRIQRFCLR
jgi:DNA-binding beta-propeller fold protein YncE